MWTFLIIFDPPCLDDDLGLLHGDKPMLIQTFEAGLPSKRLNKGIVGWFPRSGEIELHPLLVGPFWGLSSYLWN